MASRKVVIALTNHRTLGDTGKPTGFWLSEMTHPYFALHRAGFDVELISPKGGLAPIDPKSEDLNDPENREFMENPDLKAKIEKTLPAASVNPRDYAAIFFAGGHGTMWDFPDSEPLTSLGRAIYEQRSVVGAVCHGPAALVSLKLSNGSYLIADKAVTAFSNQEEEAVGLHRVVPFLLESKLVERGARFEKAAPWQPKVVVSERLVTGQNPASAKGTGEKVVELLSK